MKLFLSTMLLSLVMCGVSYAQVDDHCALDPNNSGSLGLDSFETQAQSVPMRLPFCGDGWYISYRPTHSPFVQALDFNKSGDAGQKVVAPAPGVVMSVTKDCTNYCYDQVNCLCSNYGSYGVRVKIDHGDGIVCNYAHLQCGSTGDLANGDPVSYAQQIGLLGNTGSSCGSHLHMDCTQDGYPIYLDFQESGELHGNDSGGTYVGSVGSKMTALACDGSSPPPPPTTTRAYAVGMGTGNPYAWVVPYEEYGGVNEVGLATGSPYWEGDVVVQKFRRPRDGVESMLVHDQQGRRTRAILVQDAFYRALMQFGGTPTMGPPLGNKYLLGGSAWRQDFRYGYIVSDSAGFHKFSYPHGFRPGEGSVNPSAFEAAYAAVGGDVYGNPSWKIDKANGYEFQEFRQRSGAIVRMYAIPGMTQAYAMSGKIYNAFMAAGNVYGAWGPPVSNEFYINSNETQQHFRYGTAMRKSNGAVVFTAKSRQYAPGEGMHSDHAVHIIEAYNRGGGASKFGACGAPYNASGFAYQYCQGGAFSGRAAIILNHGIRNWIAHVVRGGIEAHYAANGGILGKYGPPQTDQYQKGSIWLQEFTRLLIEWYDYAPHDVNWPARVAIGEGAPNPSPFYVLRMLNGGRAGRPKNAVHWWDSQNGTATLQDYEGGEYKGVASYVYDEVDRAARAHLMKGGIKNKYDSLGGPKSYLGAPVTDEVVSGSKVIQYFEFGVIEGDTNTAIYKDRRY